MDRRKQMDGTGDAHERYEGDESRDAPGNGHDSPFEGDELNYDGHDGPHRRDDTIPDAQSSDWAAPRLPSSIPAAEPGLLSGWAERRIQLPEEDEYAPAFDESDAQVGARRPLDSNQLDEWADSQGGDTLLTKMDMDWDEEEALTTLRDGPHGTILPPPDGDASDLEQLEDVEAEHPRASNDGEWAENIVPFRAPGGLNAPIFSTAVQPNNEMLTRFGRAQPSQGRYLWYGAAIVVGVLLAFLARSVIAPPAPATAIIVTKPTDSAVLVDGRPVSGSGSPYTVQELTPDVEHTIDVRKDGFVEQFRKVRFAPGDVTQVPEIELVAVPSRTGFALSSVPSGASVFVDDRKLEQLTPVRVETLAAGPHALRVELDGYQPWRTDLQATAGQVVELQLAQLTPRKLTWSERAAARRAAAAAARAERIAAHAARARSAAASSRSRSAARETSGDDVAAEHDEPRVRSKRGAPAEQAKAEAAEPTVRKRFISGAEAEALAERRALGTPADEAASESEPKSGEDEAPPEPGGAPVPVRANATASATPTPAAAAPTGAENGALSINSRPWSQVTIDGKVIGNTPQLSIPLAAGRHKVKLSNPELGIVKGFSVDITAGETATKTVEFGE